MSAKVIPHPHPALVNTVRCMGPGCEQIKRETNHWYLLWRDEPTEVPAEIMFHCARYSDELLEEIGAAAKPACGAACAQKLFERFLADGEV